MVQPIGLPSVVTQASRSFPSNRITASEGGGPGSTGIGCGSDCAAATPQRNAKHTIGLITCVVDVAYVLVRAARRHSSRCLSQGGHTRRRRDESRRGTHECVRHVYAFSTPRNGAVL